MRAGYTFKLSRKSADIHLWVIVSDPSLDPDRVLFVSMTSSIPGVTEDVCLIQKGEHPFVRRRTCIAYDKACVSSLDALEVFERAGKVLLNKPVSTVLLARIRAGASLSKRILLEHLEILEEQQLLD